MVTQYGSIIGIYFRYGLTMAIVLFLISYLFGKATFKVYFNREVHWTALKLVDIIKKDAKVKDQDLSEQEIFFQAQKQAEALVAQNVKGK